VCKKDGFPPRVNVTIGCGEVAQRTKQKKKEGQTGKRHNRCQRLSKTLLLGVGDEKTYWRLEERGGERKTAPFNRPSMN